MKWAEPFCQGKHNSSLRRFPDPASKPIAETILDSVVEQFFFSWLQHFCFAPRYADESFAEGLQRHHNYLALRGGFGSKDVILGVGSGYAQPLRHVARTGGGKAVGVDSDAHAIASARLHDSRLGLGSQTHYVECSLEQLPFEACVVDGAFTVETTTHIEHRANCFAEVHRVLKPGRCFCGYLWALTERYNDTSPHHRNVRSGVERSCLIQSLPTVTEVVRDLQTAGFIVEDFFDVSALFDSSPAHHIPWFSGVPNSIIAPKPLIAQMALSITLGTLEFAHLAPKGTRSSYEVLCKATSEIAAAGKMKVFTPCLFFLARKAPNEEAFEMISHA